MPKKNDYTNRSILQAGEIVEAIANAREPMGASEVARATGIKQDAAFRALYTMKGMGWVQKVGGKYRLGMKLALFWARKKSGLEGERDQVNRDIQSLEEVA